MPQFHTEYTELDKEAQGHNFIAEYAHVEVICLTFNNIKSVAFPFLYYNVFYKYTRLYFLLRYD